MSGDVAQPSRSSTNTTRRRRLLEQISAAGCAGFTVREQARYVERTLVVAPLQRGYRWCRPGEAPPTD